MVLKEYRICMPLTVSEYQRGQLYMISRHSDEQSEDGEGVEVVKNEPCCDQEYGNGQYTEKKIHLNKRLPSWAAAFFPTIAVTEKAWNFYPYTITEYECPWIPRLQIFIETRYENNNGCNNNSPKSKMHERVSESEFAHRDVNYLDIAYDKVPEKQYKESEDCTKFKSFKTGRGPLPPDWMETHQPIMCSYKLVHVKFEVWGMQTRVENYVLKVVKDILLLGHRQAFAWIDIWYDMSFDSIRDYENKIQSATNKKVLTSTNNSVSKEEDGNNLVSKQPIHSTSSSRHSSNSDFS